MVRLLDRWGRARDGQGQVVLLRGEPGIGKSRQAQALREWLARENVASLELRCSAYHQDSAFYPIIYVLQRTLNLGPAKIPPRPLCASRRRSRRRASAGRRCRWSRGSCRCRWTTGTPAQPLAAAPAPADDRTLLTWLLAAAARADPVRRRRPALGGPSTLELLTMLVEREQAAPLLTLLTFRPEFEPPWASHENLVLIELSSLDSAETVTLATVAGGRPSRSRS